MKYPDDPNFSFEKMHDLIYEQGFTIYPGKVADLPSFRLCALGAITPDDIADFFVAMKAALKRMNVALPVQYND
ncbi:hypothetical protein [Secundilactobacillus collinoides]|uniref:hypothetical protein n=1 Tax=Secundilactobacillus collinoides TaxID=33960 RepID=UPI000A5FEDCA|nr:hypothetical protein [Secundilactobacillus collinoides]